MITRKRFYRFSHSLTSRSRILSGMLRPAGNGPWAGASGSSSPSPMLPAEPVASSPMSWLESHRRIAEMLAALDQKGVHQKDSSAEKDGESF